MVSRVFSRRGGRRLTADDLPRSGGATFRAFRHRNYRLFYSGQSISLCGTWMQTIAQAWLVLQITDSKVALGTVTMLQFLPITIFVLFAGGDRGSGAKTELPDRDADAGNGAGVDAGGAGVVGACAAMACVRAGAGVGVFERIRPADATGVRHGDGRAGRSDERGGAELGHVQWGAADRAGDRRVRDRGGWSEGGVSDQRQVRELAGRELLRASSGCS